MTLKRPTANLPANISRTLTQVMTLLSNVSKRLPKPTLCSRIQNSAKNTTSCKPWARAHDSLVLGQVRRRVVSKISSPGFLVRSEERRVGKECRRRGRTGQEINTE